MLRTSENNLSRHFGESGMDKGQGSKLLETSTLLMLLLLGAAVAQAPLRGAPKPARCVIPIPVMGAGLRATPGRSGPVVGDRAKGERIMTEASGVGGGRDSLRSLHESRSRAAFGSGGTWEISDG
jgi:hypothetical protein